MIKLTREKLKIAQKFNDGGYNNMLVGSCFNAGKEARRKIASPMHRWDFSKAMEEYLGDPAEKYLEDY